MALPNSGIITLEDIQAEFGGPTNPISLQNYYRGGSYVPNVAANNGIPTSGVIGLQDFYGAMAGIPVAITAANNPGNNFRGFNAGLGVGAASPTTGIVSGGTLVECFIFLASGNLRVRFDGIVAALSLSAIVTSTGTYSFSDATLTNRVFPTPFAQYDWFVDASPFNSQTVVFLPA